MAAIKCEWEMPTISHRRERGGERERGGRGRGREREGGRGRGREREGGWREYIKIRRLLF